jgi:hypothetical protein
MVSLIVGGKRVYVTMLYYWRIIFVKVLLNKLFTHTISLHFPCV